MSSGRLADNVMHFARILREAGLPVGTDRVLLALQALPLTGIDVRSVVHDVLLTCLLDRAEHRPLFDQAFELFWRDPDISGRMMALLLPQVQAKSDLLKQRENRRLAGAMFPNGASKRRHEPPPKDERQFDAAFTFSGREQLRRADFEMMTAEEWQQAKWMLRGLRPFFESLETRRLQRALQPGRIDWRESMRIMARQGGAMWDLRWRRRSERPGTLVVLADISGSMSRYSRMLLHFAHALGQGSTRVHSFVFGTRLTPITRLMRQRDPDLAVAQVVDVVQDWSGGTRIMSALHEFNRLWARRVLDSRSTVLLITDGLEHGDTQALTFEIERLHKSCRRLVWLNPLLRYDAFEPRAAGIRAMLPHVDRFVPAHNLASLEQLAKRLAEPFRERKPWN
ncbi:MAG TPA: VWA domain-containing protein [Burkholderiaceae bacterium]|nr:VWA domain-containing protein [Burkholderiaceae bacterium]